MKKYKVIVIIPGIPTRFEKIIEGELDVSSLDRSFIFYDSKGYYIGIYPKGCTIIEAIND